MDEELGVTPKIGAVKMAQCLSFGSVASIIEVRLQSLVYSVSASILSSDGTTDVENTLRKRNSRD